MDVISYALSKKYTDEKIIEQKLKVATVEKELNDYKNTLAQVNVNQEPRQSVSGYGQVSLPKNAANGQVSGVMKGRTLKNELNYNSKTWEEWSLSTGVNGNSTGLEFTADGLKYKYARLYGDFKPLTKYGILLNSVSNQASIMLERFIIPNNIVLVKNGVVGNVKTIITTSSSIIENRVSLFIQSDVEFGLKSKINDIRIFELPQGSEIENDFETMTADELAQKYPYVNGDSTKSTISAMKVKSVGKNLFGQYTDTYTRSGVTVKNNKNGTFTLNGVSTSAVELELSKSTHLNVKLQEAIRCEAGQEYSLSQKNISGTASPSVSTIASYQSDSGTKPWNWLIGNKSIVADESGYVTMIRVYAPKGTVFSNYTIGVQFNRGKPTEYEPYKESTAYIIAKKDNKIVNLNSLPNGVKDEIRVSGGKAEHIQRVGLKTNVASGTVINYADMATGGQFVARASDGTTQTGVKGDTLTITATTLTYQLAEPETIPVQVSGNIVSNPSGTVYFEKAQPDASVYNNKITIFEQELNIDYIDKLYKIDYQTGVKTEIDAGKAVIAEDRKSFTHPDLVNGDMVFFEYYYSNETTQGEATVEYYDSRYVIPDKTLPDKFYKWDVEVDNGVPSVTVTEV